VNIYASGEHLHHWTTDDPSSSGRPRLHRRPTVSTTAFHFSFPPWILAVLAPVWRRVAVNHLPGCRPSRRSIAVPRRMAFLGRTGP
jgi:hypothetical protein